MSQPTIQASAKAIKLLILDVDGVLTNGQLFWTDDPVQIKAFNVKDGLGMRQLQKNGIPIAIITGKQSELVTTRLNELGIEHVFQNVPDKLPVFEKLIADLKLSPKHIAYVGDDLPDLPVMQKVGLSIAVQDAYPFVKEYADFVTENPGGCGAIREVCDLILNAKGLLDRIHQQFLSDGSALY